MQRVGTNIRRARHRRGDISRAYHSRWQRPVRPVRPPPAGHRLGTLVARVQPLRGIAVSKPRKKEAEDLVPLRGEWIRDPRQTCGLRSFEAEANGEPDLTGRRAVEGLQSPPELRDQDARQGDAPSRHRAGTLGGRLDEDRQRPALG